MNHRFLPRALAALVLGAAAAAASAQTANFNAWTKAGDASIVSNTAVTLTTAATESGEAPISSGSALLPDELATALSLLPASLAGDAYEGSGIRQSFTTAAGTSVSFSWSLSTVGFAADFADRAFVVIDGSSVMPLGTVAINPVGGSFNFVFSTGGSHALAILVMDVGDTTGMSTLAVSNLQVSAVPEPATVAMLLAGLGLVGGAAATRRR